MLYGGKVTGDLSAGENGDREEVNRVCRAEVKWP